ncbi:MAG: YfiR family protein [Gammaproteobacteria bacterium]
MRLVTVPKSLFFSLLCCLSLGVLIKGFAAEPAFSVREYQLKTAYLLHFAELTEWPEQNTLTICFQGHSPLKQYLPVLEGVQIHNKTLHVELNGASLPDHCRILFMSDSKALTKTLLTQAQSQHVLLVSDADDFANSGGMIQLIERNNKLRLVVNLYSVKQAGLKLSSKLLRMAEILE